MLDVTKVLQNRLAVEQTGAIVRDITEAAKGRYDELIDFSDIEAVYEALEKYVVSVATRRLRGLILTGPPGVGKTTAVVNMLKRHAQGSYEVVAGHISVVQLYIELYWSHDIRVLLRHGFGGLCSGVPRSI